MENFYFKSIPFEAVKNISFNGGYSAVYCKNAPNVAVAGDWQTRYCTLSDTFRPIIEQVYDFKVRENDVFVVTNAKCGTTWAQEMLWLIMNNFDFKKAKSIDLTERSPFLELNGVVTTLPYNTLEIAEKLESPRLLKSHLPAMLLPRQIWSLNPKIIYVFRNPKDAMVSYYHHWRGMIDYKGPIEEFAHSYIKGYINYTPFWPHALDFWQMRHSPNVCFISYERMKSDLAAVVQETCKFLGKKIDAEQLEQLLQHLSFDSMKVNDACNHIREFAALRSVVSGCKETDFRFIRRGIVGSHKDELPLKVIEECDQWIIDNLSSYNLDMNDFINYSKYTSTH